MVQVGQIICMLKLKADIRFGEDKGKAAGFDRQTTIIGENIYFKPVAISSRVSFANCPFRDLTNLQQDDKEKEVDASEEAPKAAGGKIVTCRLCKGNHMTFKCPFRDQLAALDQVEKEDEGGAAASGSKPAAGGKYVAP